GGLPHPGGAHHLHRTGARPVQDERRYHRRSPRQGRAVGTAPPDRTSEFPARDPAAASTALIRPVSELLLRAGPHPIEEGPLPQPNQWGAAHETSLKYRVPALLGTTPTAAQLGEPLVAQLLHLRDRPPFQQPDPVGAGWLRLLRLRCPDVDKLGLS